MPAEPATTARATGAVGVVTRLGVLAAVAAAGALLVWATGPSRTAGPDRPTLIVGTLTLSAGLDPVPHPIPGTVTLVGHLDHHDLAVTVRVGPSGRYEAEVAPGTWGAIGRSPWFEGCTRERCRPALCRAPTTVSVRRGTSRSIDVVCVGL